MTNDTPYGIVIHGGAGTIKDKPKNLEEEIISSLKNIVLNANKSLKKGYSSLDVVEEAVKALEDNPFFNAGKGAVYTNEGKHELDAAIMDGKSLNSGAIAGVTNIKNPISLARSVMENSYHVFLGGKGAETFAKEHGFNIVDQAYFDTEERYKQYLVAKEKDELSLESNDDSTEKKFGTVGAVALDKEGNLASATSTGGITNKLYGRIGDSPIIGAGTYANNNSCAVSATGYGEAFIRKVVAYDIHARLIYQNKSLKEAANDVVMNELLKIDGSGGIIAIDKDGNIALPFNTSGMYRAYMTNSLDVVAKIYKD